MLSDRYAHTYRYLFIYIIYIKKWQSNYMSYINICINKIIINESKFCFVRTASLFLSQEIFF